MSFCSYMFLPSSRRVSCLFWHCYWKKTSKVLRNTLCNRPLGTNMVPRAIWYLSHFGALFKSWHYPTIEYGAVKSQAPSAFCTEKAHSRLSHTRTGTKQAPLQGAFSRTELWQECVPHSAYTAYVSSGSKAGDRVSLQSCFPFRTWRSEMLPSDSL